MEDSNSAASQPAPATVQSSDEGKGTNVSVHSLAAMLKREETAQAPAEATVPAADEANNPTEAPETQQSDQPVEAEASEQAPEQTQEGEPEGDEAEVGSEEVLSNDLSDRAKRIIEKRIAKEVAKTKALEARVAEAEAKAQKLEQLAQEQAQQPQVISVAAPTPQNPLANIADLDSLGKEQQQAKTIKRWAEDALDAVESGQQVVIEGKEYTKADIRTILRNADRTLTDHIPTHYQFLQQRQAWTQKASEDFSWLKDRTSEGYQLVQAAKRNYAHVLANVPDAEYIAALAAEGMLAIKAKQTAAQKPAAAKSTPKPPASQAGTPTAPVKARVTDDVVKAKQVRAEVEKIGSSKKNLSTSDVAAMLLKQSSLSTR